MLCGVAVKAEQMPCDASFMSDIAEEVGQDVRLIQDIDLYGGGDRRFHLVGYVHDVGQQNRIMLSPSP